MNNEIDKLGTVLAVSNQINRDMLSMLQTQQKRQVRMIWASMAIVAMAIVVVGLAVFMTFNSLDKLAEQVERNSQRVEQNAEALRHERITTAGETTLK